jgi:hypothetical protein
MAFALASKAALATSASARPAPRRAAVVVRAEEGKAAAAPAPPPPKAAWSPPALDSTTPSPIFGGSTGGLLRKAQVRRDAGVRVWRAAVRVRAGTRLRESKWELGQAPAGERAWPLRPRPRPCPPLCCRPPITPRASQACAAQPGAVARAGEGPDGVRPHCRAPRPHRGRRRVSYPPSLVRRPLSCRLGRGGRTARLRFPRPWRVAQTPLLAPVPRERGHPGGRPPRFHPEKKKKGGKAFFQPSALRSQPLTIPTPPPTHTKTSRTHHRRRSFTS